LRVRSTVQDKLAIGLNGTIFSSTFDLPAIVHSPYDNPNLTPFSSFRVPATASQLARIQTRNVDHRF